MTCMVETLMCAAIRLKTGEIIVGASHAKALERQQRRGRIIENDEFDVPAGYGFMTNTGRFISPYAAWGIAVAAGQLKLGGSDGLPEELKCRQYLISEGVIFNRK